MGLRWTKDVFMFCPALLYERERLHKTEGIRGHGIGEDESNIRKHEIACGAKNGTRPFSETRVDGITQDYVPHGGRSCHRLPCQYEVPYFRPQT